MPNSSPTPCVFASPHVHAPTVGNAHFEHVRTANTRRIAQYERHRAANKCRCAHSEHVHTANTRRIALCSHNRADNKRKCAHFEHVHTANTRRIAHYGRHRAAYKRRCAHLPHDLSIASKAQKFACPPTNLNRRHAAMLESGLLYDSLLKPLLFGWFHVAPLMLAVAN